MRISIDGYGSYLYGKGMINNIGKELRNIIKDESDIK
jgi:hypothetical protein